MISSSPQPVFAAGLWARLCALTTGAPPEPVDVLNHVMQKLAREVHRNNTYSPRRLKMAKTRLPYLNGSPWSVRLSFETPEQLAKLKSLSAEIFVNPAALSLDWGDRTHAAKGPSLVMIFDDVTIHVPVPDGVPVAEKISEIVMRYLRDSLGRHVDGFAAEVKMKRADEVTELGFTPDVAAKTVVWVDGDLENFQLERLTMIALQDAIEQLYRDPEWVGFMTEGATQNPE